MGGGGWGPEVVKKSCLETLEEEYSSITNPLSCSQKQGLLTRARNYQNNSALCDSFFPLNVKQKNKNTCWQFTFGCECLQRVQDGKTPVLPLKVIK